MGGNRAMKRNKSKGRNEIEMYSDGMMNVRSYFKRFSENIITRDEDYLAFNMNGVRMDIREEMLLSLAFMPEEMKQDMEEELMGDERIVESALENYNSLVRQYSESSVKLRRLSFTHGSMDTFNGVAIASILLGKNRKASSIIMSYAILSIDMLASSYKTKADHMIDGAYIECLAYWLKSKGVLDDKTKDGMYIKMTLKEMVMYLNERIVPEKFTGNMDYYKAGVGKEYARYKLGEIEFSEYVKVISTTAGKYVLDGKIDCLVSLEDFSKQFISGEEDVKELFPEERQWDVLHRMAQVATTEEKVGGINVVFLRMIILQNEKLKREIEKTKNSQSELENSTEKAKEKEAKYKKMLREKELEMKELKKELEQANLVGKRFEELKKVGVKDVRPYKEEIERLNKEVAERKERMKAMDRENTKYQGEMNKGSEAYHRLEGINRELMSKLHEYENRDRLMVESENNSELPINVMVEPLRNKKIAIVGGDSIHYNLKELGFKNMKYLKAGETFTDNVLTNMDLIVYMTGELSHRVYYQADNIAKARGIKTHRFNNRNVNMLCKEIFMCCYS